MALVSVPVLKDFRITGRGGQGVISMQCTDRNGHIIGAIQVQDGEEVMLISDQGTLVRTRIDEISVMSRNTQGVTLIKVQEGEKLVGVARVEEPEEGDVLQEAGEEAEVETDGSATGTAEADVTEQND